MFFVCFFVLLLFFIAVNRIKKYWALPDKSKRRIPTSLMVNTPPNHNSLKDYSLQQINDGDNRRLSLNSTQSMKQERQKKRKKRGMGGGGGGGGVPTLT